MTAKAKKKLSGYVTVVLILVIAVTGILTFPPLWTELTFYHYEHTETELKVKAYAEEILNSGEHKGTHALLGSTKLAHLSNRVADASWFAFQIVQMRKDILFEGIANDLDALASELTQEAQNGYIPAEEYESCIRQAIHRLDAAMKKLDELSAVK